jgi:hypothetical protein
MVPLLVHPIQVDRMAQTQPLQQLAELRCDWLEGHRSSLWPLDEVLQLPQVRQQC